jgi:hypothetical protein
MRALIFLAAGFFAGVLVAQNAPPGGTVEGTVTNTVTGVGISGASVTLLPARSGYQATSDALGHFKIAGVPLGTYRVTASKDGFASPPPEHTDFTPGIMPTIRVASANEPARVDLKLTQYNSIFGRVLDPEGKPAAGVEVRLNPNIFGEVTTDNEGRFSLENIRPGTYTLIASPSSNAKPEVAADGSKTAMVTTYYPSVTEPSLAQPIAFRGEADLTGYEIRMQTAPVHRVRGIVFDEDGKPAAAAVVTLYPEPEGTPEPIGATMPVGGSTFSIGMRRAPFGTGEATAITKEDGKFEFPAAREGSWRLNAMSDSQPSRGSAHAVVGRSDLDDVEIRFAKPFRITAAIEWKDADARQLFTPQNMRPVVTLVNADTNEIAASGYLQPDGRLNFTNLLPGRYNAFAAPGLAAQIFLGEGEVTGQAFTLTNGGPNLRVALKRSAGSVRGTVEKGEGATVILIPQRIDGVVFGQSVTCGPGGSFQLNEVSPADYYIAAFDRMAGFQPPSAALLSLMPSRGTSVRVEEHATANVTLSVNAAPR